MKKLLLPCGFAFILFIIVPPSLAAETSGESSWETFSFNVGLFASRSETDIRYGAGLGVDINLEDALGMDSDTNVFRLETYWRFTKNKKHRADFSWFSLNRTASKTITEDITINPPNGEEIPIPAGTGVKSKETLSTPMFR